MAVMKGYKQTEVGLIPHDWHELNISDVTTKVGSGITPTGGDANYKKHGRPFVRSQNVGWGRLLLDDLAFIEDKLHSTFASSETCEGDVLLNITGASIGRSAVVDKFIAMGNVNQHVCILRPDRQRCNSKFLNGLLLSPIGQKQIDSFQAGGNRQGLNFGQIRAIKIPIPPTLREQEAIAGALSDADAWIESLEQLIAKKRQIKQGAMQELLTGKRRLPGFSGKWETKRLGDLGSTYGGLTGKTKTDFGAGGAMYVTFMNVMSNVVIDCTTFERVNVVASESQNRVVKNDILFNGSSETPEEVAMCALVDTDVTDVYLNSFCFGFRFRDDVTVVGRFLAYYLRSNVGREIMKSLAQGSTRYNLSKTALLKAVLQLPSPNEQTAIATLLSEMDTEIESLESKLAKAREVKQGMMQELLTGRIRLV
jgi:type I restriction enzyme S subunit